MNRLPYMLLRLIVAVFFSGFVVSAVAADNIYDSGASAATACKAASGGQNCYAQGWANWEACSGFNCVRLDSMYGGGTFYGMSTGCPSPLVADVAGKCVDSCKDKENSSAGAFTVPASDPSGGYCYQGCKIGMVGAGVSNPDGSKTYADSIHLGSSCTAGTGTGPAGEDVWDPTQPPTSSGGGSETGTCTNGGTDYPTCTAPGGTGTCTNGGTDYPTCTAPGGTGTCTNGGTDYPTCTSPSGTGTCTNGGTNYPTCTAPSGGGCDPTTSWCSSPTETDLYQAKTKTVSGVMQSFATAFQSSSFGASVVGIFTIANRVGACPQWVVNVEFLNTTLDIGQHFCTSQAITMMQLVGAVLFVIATYLAITWALL